MKRMEAIETIMNAMDNELIVCATGMISRESCYVHDRDENFYMIGSMGLNSSIALGLAINCPEDVVVILDGDGSILMNMGMLASIGECAPTNLIHLVLDNESYASTGGQRSISNAVSLEKVAIAAGYKYSQRVDTPEQLALELDGLRAKPRPAFWLIKVQPGNIPELPRIPLSPPEITSRFVRAVIKDG